MKNFGWRRRTSGTVRTATMAAALGLAATSVTISAAPRAEKQAEAKGLVEEALHAETFGDQSRRGELLRQAGTLAPNLDEPHWHAGEVKIANKWVKIEDMPNVIADDLRLTGYERKRADAHDTVADQLALADWCRDHKLYEQERAHLTKLLTLAPDHAPSRSRLGFLRVNGSWISAVDVRKAAVDQAVENASIATYGSDLQRLVADLSADSKLRRDRGKEKLVSITDPSMIPALERIVSPVSEEAGLIVVGVLGKMVATEAAESLARHAVLSSYPNVRAQAASELKNFSMDSFVPGLLATMTDPIQSRAQLVTGSNGSLFYRQLLSRESRDTNDVMVMDMEFNRVLDIPFGRQEASNQAMTAAARQGAATAAAVSASNSATKEANDRISSVMTTVSGQNHQTPADWWQWWNDQNEVFQIGEKQTRVSQQTRQISIQDPGTQVLRGVVAGASGQQTFDCLAAGTPVWTMRGTVAIETLSVGDLVLSQNVESGELAYKAVLRTTIRPESRLTKIIVDGHELLASGGHPMWVSGEGWVKARDLTSGQELHTPSGPKTITSVEATDPAVTYNLVVSDFNTYFVGDARVLNHDNTVAAPTAAVVPGLIAR